MNLQPLTIISSYKDYATSQSSVAVKTYRFFCAQLKGQETKTRLTDEIEKRRMRLTQVWAYLWNQWYNPNQWPLWARSACDAIPRLKTTMVVECTWKQIKRRDLPQFNRPRLDLVTHVLLDTLLPRIRYALEHVQGMRRNGRPQALASWQSDALDEGLGTTQRVSAGPLEKSNSNSPDRVRSGTVTLELQI